MTADSRVHVRLGEEMIGWLTSRAGRMHAGSPHQQARAELGLWRAVLEAELRRLRLTLPQARCVADVLGGTVLDAAIAAGAGLAYGECFDAFRLARTGPGGEAASYGAKHGIKEEELLTYLAGLGPAADHALRDAIARWWAAGADDTVAGFTATGLRIVEE
jgi:hypothetical protein